MANPLPWWLPTTSAEHRAWLAAPVPAALPYEEMSAHQPWAPGTPVLLRTDGVEHLLYVKLESPFFGPRWLGATVTGPRRICPSELSTRDPRQAWAHPWVLQLALALLAAPGDDRLAWLLDIDEETEPDLAGLLLEAQQELVVARPTALPSAAAAAAAPTIYVRTRSQIEALRVPADAVEPVNLAPGR